MLACPLLPLLQQTAKETSLLSTSDEFWLYALYSDGFNMLEHNVLTKIFYRSSVNKVEEFDEQYMFISSTSLNFQGCLLNTKWDESLQSISERYEELLVNCLCTERSDGSKKEGDKKHDVELNEEILVAVRSCLAHSLQVKQLEPELYNFKLEKLVNFSTGLYYKMAAE